jgi:sigma-B regulation protein RsbU (phosphoserine phosphatase)
MAVLQSLVPQRFHGEVAGKLASSYYFVFQNVLIKDLFDELEKLPDISALGAVDEMGKAIGIILRKDVFARLGKRFGRDVFSHKTVEKLIPFPAKNYDFERNIFSIANELEKEIQIPKDQYYLLTKSDGSFFGIFTSRDLLVYLSNITQRDINLARALQTSIVKEETLVTENGFQVLGSSRMAKGVGGDFYAIARQKNNDKWNIFICDVSGKGVSASLVTTSISGMYSIYNFEEGLSLFLNKLNNYIYYSFENQKFVTGVFLEFYPASLDLKIYDMGHSYVYFYRDEKLYKIKSTKDNKPLGVLPDEKIFGDKIKLQPNDLVFLLTDGILEQINSNEEEYGEKRFSTVVKKSIEKGLDKLKAEVFKDIFEYRGNQPQHDDMTLVILKIEKEALASL